MSPKYSSVRLILTCIAAVILLPSCRGANSQGENNSTPHANPTQVSAARSRMENLIPAPLSLEPGGDIFTLKDGMPIYIRPDSDELRQIAQFLADTLGRATGFKLPILPEGEVKAEEAIYLTNLDADTRLGSEGYELSISPAEIKISAPEPAGIFYGVETLRQLLPAEIEGLSVQAGPWILPTGTIRDLPRYSWRGMMLDVARHFFSVEDVKKLIDEMATYKLNRLHLHLSDDQGWRIEIKSWPKLASVGGSTEVGGGKGGFFTQADYSEIVKYAASRYITIIPEIDLPGHTNAALASYPELDCSGKNPTLYTGTDVGFSSLCPRKEITYQFMADVIKELSAITPGPYIHIGGDEAQSTRANDYIDFIQHVQDDAKLQGKQIIGWEDIAQAKLLDTTVVQHWNSSSLALQAAGQGVKFIMSPPDRAYMDMKYDPSYPLGLDWAGTINVQKAYQWDPGSLVGGLPPEQILGLEAPLWSETLQTMQDVENMAFPRLIGYAEMGWSPQAARTWENYRNRLAAQGPRLTLMKVNFFRSPEIPWVVNP